MLASLLDIMLIDIKSAGGRTSKSIDMGRYEVQRTSIFLCFTMFDTVGSGVKLMINQKRSTEGHHN